MKPIAIAAQEWLNALDLPLSKLTARPTAAAAASCAKAFSLFCSVDSLWITTVIAVAAFMMAWGIHSFWKWLKGGTSSGPHLTRSKELSRAAAASAAASATLAVGPEADGQSSGHKKRRLFILRSQIRSMKLVYALPAVILVAAFALAKINSPKRKTPCAAAVTAKKE